MLELSLLVLSLLKDLTLIIEPIHGSAVDSGSICKKSEKELLVDEKTCDFECES